MNYPTFKLAAVAAFLAADPSLNRNRTSAYDSRDQGGSGDGRSRKAPGIDGFENLVAGARPTSGSLWPADARVLVSPAESPRHRRDNPRAAQEMKIRRGWIGILLGLAVLLVFISVLVGFHLAEKW